MLVIVQLHRQEGTIRNLAFLLGLVVVVLEGGGGMRFAHMRPSGMVMGSTNPYVVFSTT
jgi:hypothetical protein